MQTGERQSVAPHRRRTRRLRARTRPGIRPARKGTLFDDDRCEPEPDGDAVDEIDPLGDELSDGEDDDTGEDHPPEDTDAPPEGAQHDVTVKSEPPPEDTDTPPAPCRLWFLVPRQSFIHTVSFADPSGSRALFERTLQ